MTHLIENALPTVHVIKDDQQAIEVATRLAEQFALSSAERDIERILPYVELDLLSHSGLLAITVPKRFGGAEVSAQTLATVIALLSAADGSIGQIPQNHFYALEVLRVNGTDAQQKKLYAEVLAGQRFGNALAEFHTKAANLRTSRLVFDGENYSITGQKFYCTGALYAHRIPTLVSDEHGQDFLVFVDQRAEGVKIVDDWSGFGQRTTGSGSVYFDQVNVDAIDIIPFNTAFERPTTVGPFAQLMHAAIDTGIAQAALHESIEFIRTRARAWIDAHVEQAQQDPLTIYEIGNLSVEVRATQSLLNRAARLVQIAQQNPTIQTIADASIAVAEARAQSTEVSLLAGSKLIELGGSRASQRSDNLDRFWRNARVHTLHDPVRWKYHAIGNYYLNNILPPRRGTL
ncbi:SfnB family sulfur acquisition oxidoreductase [Aquirhabdus parva]|uniref:SfnB family sulfur acquisition oxidoreductase n=1 Tax=Aquirhabdus parva TaxID=2283318 RepID=A0A345P7S8_9GAMM|nr:SfnB family sulfur acquisition oxidoreductase [Aquirhabdus parva]AXI03337.1 SfnB family sulfur acquisition oxidoreductase [Aquirhabdus parva]